jgi:hypothetical protein
VILFPFFSALFAMNNQPILFYSSRCSHSKQILDTLKTLNKQELCRLFSIDGKQRSELPPFLQKVPTLYVPETKDVFVGQAIFGYIAKPVSARRDVPTTATPPSAPAMTPGAGTVPGASMLPTLESWSFGTAGGFSDSYSSWDGKSAATSDQLHYTFLGGPAPPAGAPEPTTKQSYDGDKTGRNDDLGSRLEQLQKQRDNEFKGVSRK